MDIEKPITCKHDTLLVDCVACTEIEELQSQLETTQRELTATTISWENALAELDKAREQKAVAFIAPNGDLRKNCEALNSGEWGAQFSPLFAAPVPAMPIPKQEPVINGDAVWIVATGEHYGQHESYTLHDECPALCEGEKLYRSFTVNYDVGLIAEMLEDYGLLLRNGTIDSVHRYPPATVMEQVNLLLSEPIPAPKQEPVGAVPDLVCPSCGRGYGNVDSEVARLNTLLYVERNKTRITEQDAREIAKEFLPYWEACEMAVTVDECFDYWVATHAFSHLLNKLNANTVAEAKVNAASNQELADAIMEFSGNFIGAYLNGFIDTPFTNIAQIYQVARNHVKDSYGIETKTLIEVIGKEDFDRCYAPVPAQSAAIPEGWTLAPIDPTDEMLAAAWEIEIECHNHGKKPDVSYLGEIKGKEVWLAMLSAAQKPDDNPA